MIVVETEKSKTNQNPFSKSDIGAQSAWKGFSSQTLYIASKIAIDTENLDFFPEDIEDLVVKKDGIVIEAIQVKNISSDLTVSSLASTKSSQAGEGFFKRVCSLHNIYPSFSKVRIVYFNKLGEEFLGLLAKNDFYIKSILKKLTENHTLLEDDAKWLLSSLIFEKADIEQLQIVIANQLQTCVPIMAAPDLAQALLIQHVSDLSRTKGNTNFLQWQEEMHKIGTDIATIDGYYKEYQKSLLRLCDLTIDKPIEQLKDEFEQGVSTQPDHIRNGLDFYRIAWLNKIAETIDKNKAVIVKGVSGQGKTTLCYRYLIDKYPEQLVFCVRRVTSSRQAENLAVALKGISKHTNNMIVYIDVNPGDQHWILLIQELQTRGVSIPVLVSIREEDFKMARIEGNTVDFELIDLSLSKHEGQNIYETLTATMPHPQFRSFEEAWIRFGSNGPFIEFVYLLTNNQTLKQRLQSQIDSLLREGHPDSWFLLLQLVCFAGKIGCPLIFDIVKKELQCDNVFSAIQRLSNEYLVRRSADGIYIEALHPLRAELISSILIEKIGENTNSLLLSTIRCVDNFYVQLLLMDYFSKYLYSRDMVIEIANLKQHDWMTCAGIIKTMLWLDVKRFVEKNQDTIDDLVKKRGNGWLTFMPLDITGLLRPNEFIIESLTSTLSSIRAQDIKSEVEKVKTSLTSLQIDYEVTDLYISNCIIPLQIPTNDDEWSMFGYSLFWLAKRGRQINIPFTKEQLSKLMEYGDIKSKADAIRGIYEQNYCEFCTVAIKSLLMRITEEFCVLNLIITDDKVKCDFVPPVFDNEQTSKVQSNFNHYWKIKVLDIFEQMYSEKEYIEINLIGVDLLKDLGVEAIDHQVCIHKTNRPCVWITEINSWELSRIDYNHRSNSWECYVNQIDEIRRIANQVVVGTISYIEFLYKNQHHSNKRWDKLTADVKSVKQLLFNDVLIPKPAVDPYCVFRENMRNNTINYNNCVSKALGLSINTYAVIIESFRDVYRQLECFFDQFSEILLARLKYESLENIENPRLPLINLYNSAKALLSFQNEYNALFDNYRTLEDGFETKELEDLLTLVNMFAHVFENPIKGYPLAYDAKQLYRKSKVYIEQAFNKTLSSIGGQAHIIDGKTYLIVDFESEQENLLENEYVNVILKLRSEYEKALTFNSVRWHLETQVPELIYVPTYNSVPIASGFQMQTYRILDVSENELTKIMFPTELPESLYDILGVSCEELKKWKLAIGYLGAIKMLIDQYNDVINTLSSSSGICKVGVEKYIGIFTDEITNMISNFSDNITEPLKVLELVVDENVVETFDAMQKVFDDLESMQELISTLQTINGTQYKFNNAIAAMLLLQSYILEGIKVKNN